MTVTYKNRHVGNILELCSGSVFIYNNNYYIMGTENYVDDERKTFCLTTNLVRTFNKDYLVEYWKPEDVELILS